MSLKGNLSSVNLTEIFQMLSLSGREGTLFIYEGARKRAICFTREGVSIRSRDRNESNLLGKILVRLGRVEERDLQQAVEARRAGNRLLGDVLVEMGACGAEDVQLALRVQSEEEIQELFLNRSDAQFEYVDGYFPESDAPFVSINVNSLLIEIARRTDEWEYIRRRIRGPREIYRFTGEEGTLDPDVLAECYAHRVDPFIDGTHSVGELIDFSYVNKFEVCKLLAAYLDASVIEQVPPDAVRQNARLALRMGDTEGAIRHYEYLMTTGDFPLDVMAEAAEAHEANRDFAEAAALLRRLAEELVRQGDVRSAIDALRSVATYPRPEPEALSYLMDLVVDNPRAALEFAGNIIEAGKTLVAYYGSHDQRHEAVRLLERLLKIFPDEVAFAISLVNVHYEEGDVDRAANECERFAVGFLKRKRITQAVSLFKKLLVIDPERQDIRERIRKIVSGKQRKPVNPVLPRVAIALAVSLLVGGAAVVVVQRETGAGGGPESLSGGVLQELFGRGVDSRMNAVEHGRRARTGYEKLLARLSKDPLENRKSLLAELRQASQNYKLFEEHVEKVCSISETIQHQTASAEVAARAKAMEDSIRVLQREVQAARRGWSVAAQEAAVRLRERGIEIWKLEQHLEALEHFELAAQIATQPEWRNEVLLDQFIENIRRDVEDVDRRLNLARLREEDKDWTSARRIYLDLLQEYRSSDLIAKMQLPLELLTVPPGATIRLGGETCVQPTPAIVRVDPHRDTEVELTLEGFETTRFTLPAAGHQTQAERYEYVVDLAKKATWRRAIRGHVEADPAVARGRVAVAERNGRLFLFDARTGKEIASQELNTLDGVTAGLATDGAAIYICSLDGKFFAFDAAEGNPEIALDTKRPGVYATPVVADGRIYTVDRSGFVTARDAATREPVWRQETGEGIIRAAPLVHGENLVIVSVSGDVTILRRADGAVHARYQLRGVYLCAPVAPGPDLLVFASEEGTIYGVNAHTGAVAWERKIEGRIARTPPVRGRTLFVSPQPGQLIAFDTSTGDEIYRYVRGTAAARVSVMDKNRIFFADGRTLSAFAPRPDGYGLAWAFEAEGRILAGPVQRDGAVYIADEKGNLYRLEAEG